MDDSPSNAKVEIAEGRGLGVEPFGTGLRALVVDNDGPMRRSVRTILEGHGFEVETAETVRQALEAAAQNHHDVAVIDEELDDGGGLEIAHKLRQSGDDTALILVTSQARLASAMEAIRLGVADYLTKPCHLNDLQARLERVVKVLALARHNRQLIEELQEKNAALQQLAVRDSLTRLFNYTYFQENLEQEISRAIRNRTTLTVLFIDVDHFRKTNERLGHRVGDSVLQQVANILSGAIRSTDTSHRLEDIAARFGGDEFAIVLPETRKPSGAATAERLRCFVANHDFEISDLPPITLSIGVASYPDDADGREELIEAASTSLSVAKRAGRNQIVSYAHGLTFVEGQATQEINRELARIAALDQLIERQSFRFDYQPIVDLKTGTVFGFEALMRPDHPLFEGPLDVIGVAERSGRIRELGRVLRAGAARALPKLPDDALMFINLHPLDMHDPELLALEPFFEGWADRVVLELTETTILKEFDRALARIETLRGHGFRIGIDDFGAGYSGINRLARLEPDIAKLDMELVRGIAHDDRRSRLISHILDFCASEGMSVVAEGVETEEELDVVRRIGCPLAQGYYFARPEPPFTTIRVVDPL